MPKKRVLVGMSGGVDSSAAAALLLEQGYEVVGATMDLLPDGPSPDLADAKRVASALGIEHHVLPFQKEFAKEVMTPFCSEYLAGRTPNPCIFCNRAIKFGEMVKAADRLCCDFVATGHYARIEFDQSRGRFLLKRADTRKDQSYVLYHLSQHQLSRVLLPLAPYTKDEIRAIAARYALPVAHKGESQEICFVKNNDYASFVTAFTGKDTPPGDFVDEQGQVIGRHKGILHYTIGQRKGLGQSFGRHMYVSQIDPAKNTVCLVESGREYFSGLTATHLNAVTFDRFPASFEAQAMIRYQAKPAPCRVELIGEDRVKVTFQTAQRAVTPGQSVVFYEGDTVLGGGVIDAGLPASETHRPPETV